MDFNALVEKLVRQTVDDVVGMITADILKEETTFGNIIKGTKKKIDELGVSLLQSIIERVDEIYAQSRPKGIQIKNRQKKRTMLTTFGEITLTRRLYNDVESNRRFFAVDELLKLPKHTRVEPTLQVNLMEQASKRSFGAVAKALDGQLSRQSIFNIVKKNAPTDTVKYETSERKIKRHLYIEADEDHIHLNNGDSGEIKLVYVHEGRTVENGRTKLINPMYFVGLKGDEVFEKATDYLYECYDVDRALVHVAGDGANWIKGGYDDFLPNTMKKFHLDKFHVVQSVTRACGGNYKDRAALLCAIKHKNAEEMQEVYRRLLAKKNGSKTSIMESKVYLENNFSSISLSADNACSAEGHVSHVLSARLSSRPCGWSAAGALRIAKIRAFAFSGGDFSALTPTRDSITFDRIKEKSRKKKSKGIEKNGIPLGRVVGIDGLKEGTFGALKAILRLKTL